ncbi:hypothetical protein Pcinc_023810 [Petrolisthes cinctipes]|uniref:C2H2-type domain-containing protein n=1 Tax=Petrolisthes cinctipes TaxID=88211 RepID=A0AAE1KDY0_PETCI|nr:hypothetical protein Pcinc_023810 [Petrolisthes cinctipes]
MYRHSRERDINNALNAVKNLARNYFTPGHPPQVIGSCWGEREGQDTAEPQTLSPNAFPVGPPTLNHNNNNNGVIKVSEDLETRQNSKSFCCCHCSYTTDNKAHMRIHMRRHTGEKPYQCPTCHKKFSRAHDRSRHVLIHTGETPFMCPHCSLRFNQKCNMRHPPQVKVKLRCRDDKRREGQTKAEPGSPDPLDKLLSCCHCSFNTTSTLLLGLHMHTHKGGKPYHCPICLKKFSCARDHSRHIQTHTGEKPYSCPYCPLRFNQKCNMTYHIETCHPHEYVVFENCWSEAQEEEGDEPQLDLLCFPKEEKEEPDHDALYFPKQDQDNLSKPGVLSFTNNQKGKQDKDPVCSTNQIEKQNKDSLHSTNQTGKQDKDPICSTNQIEKQNKDSVHSTNQTGKQDKDPICSTNQIEKQNKDSVHSTNQTGKQDKDPVCSSNHEIVQPKPDPKSSPSKNPDSPHQVQPVTMEQKNLLEHTDSANPMPHFSIKVYRCRESSFYTYSEPTLVTRTCRENNKKVILMCTICSKTFISTNSLKRHMKDTHIEKPPHSCPHCPRRFTSKDKKKSICPICPFRTYHKSGLEVYMRSYTGEKPFTCPLCPKKFTRSNDRKQHLNIHTGERPFACPICSRRFIQKSNLKSHMRTHTREKPYVIVSCWSEKREGENRPEPDPVTSRVLPTTCPNNHSLIDLPTSDRKKVTCPICHVKTYHKSGLDIHMRSHTGEKPFACPYCPKKFTRSNDRKQHIRIHTGEKPFACPVKTSHGDEIRADPVVMVCGPQTLLPLPLPPPPPHAQLEVDVNTDDLEERGEGRTYSCPYCSFTAFSKCRLVIHVRNHTGERPFQCQICLKKFSRAYDRNRHLLIHSGEKPYVIVDSWSVQQDGETNSEPWEQDDPLAITPDAHPPVDSIIAHNTHDSSQPPQPVKRVKKFACPLCHVTAASQSAITIHLRTHTGEKPFTCDLCLKKFTRLFDLKRHIQLHTGDMHHTCPHCPEKFTEKRKLNRHMQKHFFQQLINNNGQNNPS